MTTSSRQPKQPARRGAKPAPAARKSAQPAPAAQPVSKPAPPTRRRPTDSDDEQGTRQRVVEAAIQCILEQGFYRASSNAIAEAAGLSWGVIQYYFGSREGLMLAVLEEGNRRLRDVVSQANITGATMAERLEQYFLILEPYYGHSDYLAFIQVLLNLSHDPRTSGQTTEAMTQGGEEINIQFVRLTNQLFAGTGIRRPAVRNLPFHALRGLALSEVMLETLPYATASRRKRVEGQGSQLARALSLLMEEEATPATRK
jgi:AcrR family transcriptional regulator